MNTDNLSLNKIGAFIRVSPSVLSNWQKRYSDFPKPSQLVGRRRLYRLADVEAFIARHGLFVKKNKNDDKIVWVSASMLRSVGATYEDVVFVIASIAYLWANRMEDLKWLTKKGDVSQINWPIQINMKKLFAFAETHPDSVQQIAQIWFSFGNPDTRSQSDNARKVIVRQIYDYLLSANDKAGGYFVTFPSLAQLINKIGRGLDILDLTTGVGEILNTYEKEANSLWGRDINQSAVELQLLLNLVRFGDPKRNLSTGDSVRFLEDIWLNKFDVVICEPPLGLKLPVGPFAKADVRWTFFEQANIQYETDWWIQTVLSYLRPHVGDSSPSPRGIVATGESWLNSASEESMRTALIRRGHIEAVISLGGGLYSGTQIPLNLVILRKTDNPANTVRLIDATALGKTTRSTRHLSSAEIAKIVQALNSKVGEKSGKKVGNDENQIICVDITLDELIENDSVLLPRRYRPVQKSEDSPPDVLEEMLGLSDLIKNIVKDLADSIESGNGKKVLEHLSGLKNVNAERIKLDELGRSDSRIEILFKNRQQGAEWGESDFVDGDILICLSGPQVGECVDATAFRELKPSWVRMLQLRTGNDESLFNYLAFWFKHGSFKEQVERLASGTTLRTLSKSDLNRILVPFPDRDYEKLLGSLYSKIILLTEMEKQVAVVSELLSVTRKKFLSSVLSNVFPVSHRGLDALDSER